MPRSLSILAIDDDPLFLEIVEQALTPDGHRVERTADPREGLRRAMHGEFDLVLLDLMMPELTGQEVLELLKPLQRGHRVFIVSAHSGADIRSRARDLGASAYLQKPVSPGALRQAVAEVAAQSAGRGKPGAPVRGLPGLVAGWVFEEGAHTSLQAWSAVGILAALAGLAAWLITG